MAPEQVDSSRFIELTHPLNLAEPVLDILKKAQGDLAAIARANPAWVRRMEQQRAAGG